MIYFYSLVDEIFISGEKLVDYLEKDDESKFFRIPRRNVSAHGNICVSPFRRAGSPRELNEAERSLWIRKLGDQRTV